MLRSFLAGAVTGGVIVWFFRDDIQAFLDEQARQARQRAADRLHDVGDTAERAFDRAAAPIRRAEELLDQGKVQVTDTLRAAEQKIRP
jgi:hypothetical protein